MILFDASCLLALSKGEPGADVAERHMAEAAISAANLAEALAKAKHYRLDQDTELAAWSALGLTVIPVTMYHAKVSASLWAAGRPLGLSLGDRLCAAVALVEGLKILTSDSRFAQLDAGVKITMIR